MSIDEVFRALNDPTRREILRLLRSRDMAAGEMARLRGLDDDATRCFEHAAAGAATNEYHQYTALALELLARHHSRNARTEPARAAFEAAAAAYDRWGATLKAQDVRAQRP